MPQKVEGSYITYLKLYFLFVYIFQTSKVGIGNLLLHSIFICSLFLVCSTILVKTLKGFKMMAYHFHFFRGNEGKNVFIFLFLGN